MEILIAIGIITFLILFFWGSNSTKTPPNNKQHSVPSTYDSEQQAQERLRLEDHKRQQEEHARQEEQRRQAEQERQQEELARQQEQRRQAEQERQNAKVASYKTDWTSFQTVLQQHNITQLYHFTDRANLASIRQHGGLLSWYYCKQNDITIPMPGGSSTSWILDERKGLQNFVRVSFVPNHPMLFVAQKDGRITNPIVLEIKPEIIFLKSTKFTSENAAKNGITAEATIEKFNDIRFPVLGRRYFDLSVEDKSFYQAEVLILEKVPLEYITNINHV